MVQRGAGEEITTRDFAGQRFIGPVHHIAADEVRIAAADRAKQSGKFPGGEQRVVRAGGGERDVIGILGELPHPRHQVAQADVGGPGHGPGHARFGDTEQRARAHIIAALRPGLEIAAVLEQHVGLQDGGDAHAALEGHAADRRHAVSGAQGVLLNEPQQRCGDSCIERPGGRIVTRGSGRPGG